MFERLRTLIRKHRYITYFFIDYKLAYHMIFDKVTDVTDPLIRCYENNTASQTSIATVQAGSTYSIIADGAIYHPGVSNLASLNHPFVYA